MKHSPNRKPKVSLILPAYNTIGTLDGCLRSIVKITYPNLEIIIVDDQSIDGTYERLVSFFEKYKKLNVKILRNSINKGASYTRNRAVKSAKGEYIAFVETDMEFEKNWLEGLVDLMEKRKDLGAVTSKVCDLDKKDKLSEIGLQFSPATFGVVNIGEGQNRDKINRIGDVGLGAVGTLYRLGVVRKVGGLDEKFGHNIDDIELSWRMWVYGYPQMNVLDSITYHQISKPYSKRSLPMIRSEMITHKVLRVFLKNYELKSLIIYIPQLISYQLLRVGINIVLRRNLRPLIGFILGYLWLIMNLRDCLKQRAKIQKNRRLTDKEIINRIGYKGNYINYVRGNVGLI